MNLMLELSALGMKEMVKIITDYAPISSNHRPGYKQTEDNGVTVHETGNYSKGAGALAHRNYYHRLCRTNDASIQIGYTGFVDDKVAYLVQPIDEVSWTCGNKTGNNTTCSIEICVNPESNFNTAFENGAYFSAWILKQKGYRVVVDGLKDKANGNLWQHWSWSGKNCPQQIRQNGMWDKFVTSTQKYLDALWGSSAPSTPNKTEIKPFLVRVVCDVLNVRKAPGTNNPIVTRVHQNEVYTIVDTKKVGTVKWGKLKSGAGWISLNKKYTKEV